VIEFTRARRSMVGYGPPMLFRARWAMLSWLWSILCVGCVSVDTWTPTREACGIEEPYGWEVLGPATEKNAEARFPIEEACARRVVEDLGGDPDEILDDLGGYETYEALLADDAEVLETASGMTSTLRGMVWLLGADLGAVDELQPDDWTDTAYIDVLEGIEVDLGEFGIPVSQALYIHVTDHVAGLVVSDSDEFSYNWGSRKLHIPQVIDTVYPKETDPDAPVCAAAILVHESRHDTFGGRPHQICPAGSPAEGHQSCDDDLTDAYGFAVATVAAAYRKGACESGWDIGRALELVWTYHMIPDYPGLPEPDC